MSPGRELPSLVLAHSPSDRRLLGRPTLFEDESRPHTLFDGCTVRAHIAGLDIHCPSGMRVDGVRVKRATVADRQVVRFDDGAVYVFAWRPRELPLRVFKKEDLRGFGEPDAYNWIAESAEGVRFRDACAIAALARGHVLLDGESGTGKGIVARALVAMSPRANRPAEVCAAGQVPTLKELLAHADGGTLIVDPVDSLGPEAQASLLHLARTQREDSIAAGGDGVVHVRILALAREISGPFGNDLRRRFDIPLSIPSFRKRLDDVMLVMRARARKLAERAPALAAPFLDDAGEVRLTAAFVEGLLVRVARGDVFPFDAYLWRAMEHSGALQAGPHAVDHVEEGPPSRHGEGAATPVARHATTSVAPAGDPAAGLARRLGLPQARVWSDVRLRVVDGLTLNATVRDKSAHFTFLELGLATEVRAPARAWEVLIAMCEGRGALHWRDLGDTRDAVRKQISAVKAVLRAAFELAHDPFEVHAKKGWVARFLAVPER